MRFFQPEVEAVLKMLGVGILVASIVVPMTWGYEQHRQAQAWQSVACAYRMRELARHTPLVAAIDDGRDACSTLQRLGLDLKMERLTAP